MCSEERQECTGVLRGEAGVHWGAQYTQCSAMLVETEGEGPTLR